VKENSHKCTQSNTRLTGQKPQNNRNDVVRGLLFYLVPNDEKIIMHSAIKNMPILGLIKIFISRF
jgi:hypothetical protein